MIRTYTELSKLKTFGERFMYLKLDGAPEHPEFGGLRWVNQSFYRSEEWRRIRRKVILRDNGCDLGLDGYQLNDHIIIHHMNPLILDDIRNRTQYLLNPEYLICCSKETHNAIHRGDLNLIPDMFVERHPNDQIPWR